MSNEDINIQDNKNKGGRPPVWPTPEDLRIDIEHYKLFCEQNKEEIPDIESFCYFVMEQRKRDTFDRKTFQRYEDKEGFAPHIKNIKNFMSYKKKQLAMQGKIPAAIFCFDFKNNHDYVDKQDHEISNKDGKPFQSVNTNITLDDIKKNPEVADFIKGLYE